ncbi:hypothetical protein SG34_012410 [Thalassomonas viridans]|uniref:Uncharacterized protein n=1 Tax=Thalassomonas viridans TaxID=137584 RepID=A0AAE9Z6I2_9GAMM|nr:hypothetical protein [Thalassomonas viridans]WDE07615.1 hypothetical protein SG34_012410 [Thalassomonas viridans]
MKSITDVLERIGQQSNLKYGAEIDCELQLTEMRVPAVIRKVLITNDKSELAKLSDTKKDIVCFIAAPGKEHEMPKDDNKPSPEEPEHQDEQSAILVNS